MAENQATGRRGLFGFFGRRFLGIPEIQTRDTEENRPLRYAVLRIWLRVLALSLVFLEVVLIGPSLPLWLALAALIYSIDRVRLVLDTHDPLDVVIRPKPNLRHDPRFLTLTILASIGTMMHLQDVWFPVWFPARDGYLWWETTNATGRILPGMGALAYWIKLFVIVGIPLGFWDPLKVLDWVYKVESVWTQYRNTQFVPAEPSQVETPMGTLPTAPKKPKPEPEPITVRLTSAPLPPSDNGGNGQVRAIEQERDVVDL